MSEDSDQLLVLWTNDDKVAAMQMVLLYAKNAKVHGWWGEVTLLIWGSSATLVAGDTEVQRVIRGLQRSDVRTIACKKCAENLGLVDDLEKLNIDVFYTGEFLTEWLKSDREVLAL